MIADVTFADQIAAAKAFIPKAVGKSAARGNKNAE
jgi:hypothetical protein